MRRRSSRLVVTAVLVALPGFLVPVPAMSSQGPSIEPTSVGIVVLVDESGSLGDEGVTAERAAAALIAQSEFSPESTIAVVGFGGRNGQPGQSPVQVVCQPTTVADGPDRDYLSTCVDGLHRRTTAEGDATDFPSALSQALSLLAGMHDVGAKVVFLMTDGQLDVRDDDAYGDPADRQDNARSAMRDNLTLARERDIPVWPLGFGDAKQAELDEFAKGGSQRVCNVGAQPPTARIVADNLATVTSSLADAYANARCGATSQSVPTPIGAGETVELRIDIPPIATDGSIAVSKVFPGSKVSYEAPDGETVPKSGRHGAEEFEVSGEGSQVEVLRVRNPQAGTWVITVTAPPTAGNGIVNAIAIWQGAVRSTVALNPPSPRPGEKATVELTLRTRTGALADPGLLQDITAAATFTGEGFDPRDVPLVMGDDGRYTGEVVVPSTATGNYEVVGSVRGRGIAPDERPSTGSVNLGGAAVRAQVRFDRETVAPGGTLDGELLVSNDSGTARRVTLQLGDLDEQSLVTISPAESDVAASGNTSIPFTLRFDENTKLGFGEGRLRVVDKDGGAVYADRLLTFEVDFPPTAVERLWYLWVAICVVLLAALALALRARRRTRARQDVRGLRAELHRHGRSVAYLVAPDERSNRFRFVVRDEDAGLPRLHHAGPGDDAYVASRGVGNVVVVHTPHGEQVELGPDTAAELSEDLELVLVDTRTSVGSRPTTDVFASRTPSFAEDDGESDAFGPHPFTSAERQTVDDDDLL